MVLGKIQQVSDIGKSKRDKQREITVSEVWHLWDHLLERYSVINTTQILDNFVEDNDLKYILNHGVKVLQTQASELEKIMGQYGIPLPVRPPAENKSTLEYQLIDDRYIFRRVFRGIQSFVPIHAEAFLSSPSPKIREVFQRFLLEEISLYNKFFEYGKLKAFVHYPPLYRS